MPITRLSGQLLKTGSNGTVLATASAAISSSFATNASLLNNISPSVYATTGSNTFNGNQIISGSLTITQNLTVQQSSSITYLSQSTLNVGTNIITVNTNAPTVRFGGLAVIDSGSSPLRSGSILFDSTNDQWIFVHQNIAGGVTSSVLVMGPATTNNIGNETLLTQNKLIKGSGLEHVTDSIVTDNGSQIQVAGTVSASSFTSSIVTGVGFFGTASYALTPAGTAGSSGTSGQNGSSGTSGSSGSTGTSGSSGSTGTSGSSGSTGTSGSSGSSGTRGSSGTSGSSGSTGTSGSSGSTGTSGSSGSTGTSGSSGSTGTSGSSGSTGTSGSSGSTGTSGSSGSTGTSGSSGSTGTSGSSGSTGTSGANGAPGSSGSSGSSGTSGAGTISGGSASRVALFSDATTLTSNPGLTYSAATLTLSSSLTFDAGSNRSINWSGNTDGAVIKFVTTADSVGNSYLEIGTTDNSDEPIKFTQTGNVRVQIDTDGLLKNGAGTQYVLNSGNWSINAANVTGTVAIANGGTGAVTQQAAINALAGAVTNARFLRGDGTNVSMAAIQASDVPTLNQNTTGTAANVTGTVAVANGGTGLTTLSTGRIPYGAGTSAINSSANLYFDGTKALAVGYAGAPSGAVGSEAVIAAGSSAGGTFAIVQSGTTEMQMTTNGTTAQVFSRTDTLTISAGLLEQMRLIGSAVSGFGGVIVGSASTPLAKLHVSASNSLPLLRVGSNASSSILFVTGSGRVGMNTTTPTSTFDIRGTAGQLFSITDSLTGTIMSVNDISGIPILEVAAASTNVVTVTGEIRATSEITAYYSDERLKTKTGTLDNSLDIIRNLSGFKYINNDIAKSFGYTKDKVQIGLSAQNVQQVLPEIVSLAPFDTIVDSLGKETSKTGKNYLTVDYSRLVPVLVEAIKELETRIKKLEGN